MARTRSKTGPQKSYKYAAEEWKRAKMFSVSTAESDTNLPWATWDWGHKLLQHHPVPPGAVPVWEVPLSGCCTGCSSVDQLARRLCTNGWRHESCRNDTPRCSAAISPWTLLCSDHNFFHPRKHSGKVSLLSGNWRLKTGEMKRERCNLQCSKEFNKPNNGGS